MARTPARSTATSTRQANRTKAQKASRAASKAKAKRSTARAPARRTAPARAKARKSATAPKTAAKAAAKAARPAKAQAKRAKASGAKASAKTATPTSKGKPGAPAPQAKAGARVGPSGRSVKGGATGTYKAPVVEFTERPGPKPMRIVLFGASGNIGRRIAREALARGHEVSAVVRDPSHIAGSHPNLHVFKGDATDPIKVAAIARSHDVVASAISPDPKDPDTLREAAQALVEGARDAGVKRALIVGGAGSLYVKPGVMLLDSPSFPAEWRPTAMQHKQALDALKATKPGVDWTFVCPAAMIEPGARTGGYRIGTDNLLADKDGNSRISMEDYAVAFVDEIERGKYRSQRMTVAY